MLEELPTGRGVSSIFASWTSIVAHSVLLMLLILTAHHAWQVRPVSTRGASMRQFSTGRVRLARVWRGRVSTVQRE